ncbi:alpha-1,4-glucan--maltose-1-phosphate maltosyltransferase [Pseudarthrobacter sp. J75]|uniref:alpha-1,4-glucan--maltose-1-phosphate maltosyltransferase n=1 Tax=unclassified Pseudarthrobacter TaxID=2647000 RepID=UPI002E8079F6|nr:MULTISPECIES: alpha-1,4-glucan--maltose-1-phosphate maltosyltransferase [unclassified Pseudarthrobacter]MEE2524652.1 alpha-1,4-glucan--maltose-1-phosphate maltosyltransferase [Pseudarthrobacter sp. J47]MEE2530690.1 alpha-1,4-glucan--maltose-1-phosphate maltosyltransferase [Pseudarthrobacter sp. J75]
MPGERKSARPASGGVTSGLRFGRFPITAVQPVVEDGRFPAKAVPGEAITVGATAFREGHDQLGVSAVLFDPQGVERQWVRLRPPRGERGLGTDRWEGLLVPGDPGDWSFAIEAWHDRYGTWHHNAEVKVAAGIDVELMLAEGAALLAEAADDAGRDEADQLTLRRAADALADESRTAGERLAAGFAPEVAAAVERLPIREMVTTSQRYPLLVERDRAGRGSWYEFFPRSEGAVFHPERGTWTSGTFRTAAKRLDAVAEMGFDVLYMPPIHPIGVQHRKGPNNTLVAGPHDPGSPWAIGAKEGGHDSIHPDLGTFEDFDAFVARANELGLEVALDLALQAAPDHPWVESHPEWFTTRIDGSIAYAENPPKKYQDIYPLNFDNDPEGLSHEILRVVELWVSHGVRIFRVDNPHTKPVWFWEWLIQTVNAKTPGVVFLAEAFTRPAMMHALGRAGFQQSYTYFTWRNTKEELESYFTEVSHESPAFFRPNFFVNTPDILTPYLQFGGPGAFRIRAALAATASPLWGVYAGFELFEHVARPGAEEYIDNEKFEYKARDWEGAARSGRTLAPYLTRLNEIRRAHPALLDLQNLTVHASTDDSTVVYSKHKTLPDGSKDTIIVVVNVDPHGARESTVTLDLAALELDQADLTPSGHFRVDDLITGQSWEWGTDNYVRLDPHAEPAHILSVRRTRP